MIERGKYLGQRVGPPVSEGEHYLECPQCGGMMDMRDLASVMAHQLPLPHPVEDQKQ